MTIANIQNYCNSNARIGQSIASTRAERISVNEREIVTLENEIAVRKNSIKITEDLIASSNKKIEITEQLIAAKEKLVETHGEQKGLMIEARDAAIKVVNANDKIIALETKRIEDLQKLMDIVKNMHSIVNKYRGLSNTEIQKQPQVTEAKVQVTLLANSKIEEYPKEIRSALTETAKKVIDTTFTEINSINTKAARELFSNLGNRIEAALDKKYETLSVKDFNKLIDANYKSIENFFRIKRFDYLDLALKDIKV